MFCRGGGIHDLENQLKTEVMTIRFSKSLEVTFTASGLTKILGITNVTANPGSSDRFDLTNVDYIKIVNNNQIKCKGRDGTNGWNGNVTYDLTLIGY